MHFCLLVGYGAGAVNPYLAYATMAGMIRRRPARATSTRTTAVQQLHQGGRQEHDQGRVEDGHLDDAELSRRADLRGDRARPRSDRQVLHLDRRRASAASASTRSRARPPSVIAYAFEIAAESRRRARRRRPVPVAPRAASSTCTTRTRSRKLQHSVRSGNYRLFKEYTRLVDEQSRSLATLRALLKFKLEPAAGAARRSRAGHRDRQALQDRRDVVRIDRQGGAREPRDRDEPDRRQEQHRRGRRGSRRVSCAMPTAIGAAARSSRWRRRASASPVTTWSTPTSCKSRWRRAPSRARAASFPATRSTISSRRFATRRRASD